MPFPKWAVQPVFISRSPKPPDKIIQDFEFETTTNNTLVKCMRQMGSLLQHADRIFDEIAVDCRLAMERAERISAKIQTCQEIVSNLNARAVKVPVSDLTAARKCCRREPPYRTTYEQSSQLLLPSTRPRCVDRLYGAACASPVSVMCTLRRPDGCASSQLFMVTPVLGGARRKRRKMLDIETRKPASFSLAALRQDARKPGGSLERRVVSPSGGGEERLPSPEELALAVSLEYPSTVVPVDVSGNSFLRMSRCRRSLIHADFEIKRKKSKSKRRRHTVCEGDSKDLQEALQSVAMVSSSCQTEEPPEPSSLFSFRRSFSRKKRPQDAARRETVALDGLTLDFSRPDASAAPDTAPKPPGKSLLSRAAKMNPISAAISMAVRMRHPKASGKQDDGRSSSGNWSASSSARASLDSDQQRAVSLAADRRSNVSRCSVGKDSVLSDATTATTATAHPDSARPPEQGTLHDLPKFPTGRAKSQRRTCWDYDTGRDSNTSTPERTSDCGSTPVVMSPYIRRKHQYAGSAFDDGESSVYSVDTDGYYTSMHTDSGLWNALNGVKSGEGQGDSIQGRRRQESQSSVSTIGNGSINSFLSKVATENDNSSSCSISSLKKSAPEPPPRVSSFQPPPEDPATKKVFEKETSPAKNGSASESDYESRDRIRVKTTINSSRYPSLCAVSPETSDDELSEMQAPTKQPTKSVVVAEVHREEPRDTASEAPTCPQSDLFAKTAANPTSYINMYGGHSPSESSFASSLAQSNATSTPKQKGTVSSFTTDLPSENKEPIPDSPSLVQKLVSDLKNIPVCKKEIVISSPPVACRSENKQLIPLKYAQRITVTPIVRNESVDSIKSCITPQQRSKSFLKNPLSGLPFRHGDGSNSKPKSPSYISFQSPDSPVSSSTSLSPELGRSTTPTTKAVARVTLDPAGKVIYSSSSLDRNVRENRGTASLQSSEPKYATLPKYQHSPPSSDGTTAANATPQYHRSSSATPPLATNKDIAQKSPNLLFRPSRGGRFCRTYFPSHIISSVPRNFNQSSSFSEPAPRSSIDASKSSYGSPPPTIGIGSRIPTPSTTRCSTLPSANRQAYSRPSPDFRTSPSPQTLRQSPKVVDHKNINHSPSVYQFRPVTVSPVPGRDGFVRSRSRSPLKTSTFGSQSKISPDFRSRSLGDSPPHSYQQTSLGKISEFTPPNPPDVIPSGSTPPSTLDVTARTVRSQTPPAKPPSDLSSLKSMSSSELFAIIHSSKKKHNIKSESERSLSPLSSRSSSPGMCLTPSPSKTPKIETGVLARGSPSPRNESASDRLGRSRPTSMHDFKMLLLQTRLGGHEPSSRPSAAELLKVSPPHSRPSPSTLPRLSPKPAAPKKEPGHGTVPVKRMTRTRSPYLTRYDSTYPPIWEDCSEDLEASDENQNRLNTAAPHVKVYSSKLLDNEKPSARQASSTWV